MRHVIEMPHTQRSSKEHPDLAHYHRIRYQKYYKAVNEMHKKNKQPVLKRGAKKRGNVKIGYT